MVQTGFIRRKINMHLWHDENRLETEQSKRGKPGTTINLNICVLSSTQNFSSGMQQNEENYVGGFVDIRN